MKFLSLILSAVLLNGCVASSYVSSIGAKSVHGYTRVDLVETDLSYSKRTSNPFGVVEGDVFSFTDLYVSGKPYDTTTAEFNYDDITWAEKGSTNGKIDILVKGKLLTFSVFKAHDYVELEHNYRQWYGYPAQSLLIFSIPVDIVVMPIIGIGFLVTGLAMEPPLH